MKKKKSNESSWFNKPVFYSMAFLTMSSLITSCTLITSTPTKIVEKQPVVIDVPNVNERILLACDKVSGMFVCDRLN